MTHGDDCGRDALSLVNNRGQAIRSIDDWKRLAPPQHAKRQWKDFRSAKELARAWLRTGKPAVPEELTALLDSHEATRSLVIETAIPEVVTGLDRFGKGRHHDLVALGRKGTTPTLVAIEAKADEGFAKTIGECVSKVKKSSNIPRRINLLIEALISRGVIPGEIINPQLAHLRVQLLHAVGGTLIEARRRGCTRAVFVVHEFQSDRLDDQKVRRNATDFEKFVRALTGCKDTVDPGQLVGPVEVPGGEFVPASIPLFLGKVSVKLTICVDQRDDVERSIEPSAGLVDPP